MVIVGRILLGILLLIVLVLFCPVRVKTAYTDRWYCRVFLFGFLPVYTLKSADPSGKDKPKKVRKNKKDADEKPSVMQEIKALYKEEGVGGILSFLSRVLAIAKEAMVGVVRAITIRQLALCVRVGGEEADETAVTYGRINAVLYPLLTALSKVVRIRRQDVRVFADFTVESTQAKMRMVVWVWPFAVLWSGLCALVRLVVLWVRRVPSVPKTENKK